MAVVAAMLPLQCADASSPIGDVRLPAQVPTITDVAYTPRAIAWADSVMATLTLKERVAQLVVPRLDVTDNEAGRAAVRRAVVTQQVGGLLFGKGTLAGYAGLIAYAQSLAKVPLLITLDGEWGLNMRVTDAPQFPVNMAIGASMNPDIFTLYGAEVARECRAVGINVNFAPVLDVNSNPKNPVIGYRSFGEDPKRVAAAGIAYSQGLEGGGVLSVAKHFPGHGDTSTDSHKTLPTVDHTVDQLEATDLLPFRQYIDQRLGGVMVGHLSVPALDKKGTPASLSAPITTGLLREKMKFRGLVFTDALAMAGADSKTNNCVAALQAGTDILLQPKSTAADIEAVLKAVERGTISRGTIDERCRKVLAFKYALGLDRPATPLPAASAAAEAAGPQAEAAAMQIAKASLTAITNGDNILPIADLSSRTIAVVSIGAATDNIFSNTCARYCSLEKFSVGTAGASQKLLSRLAEFDVVLIGVFTDKAWSHKAYAEIIKSAPASVGVFFMNPYKMAHFGRNITSTTALVLAGDDTPQMREAAAEGVFGGCAMSGRMPVALPGIARLGEGVTTPKVRLGFTMPTLEGFASEMPARIDSVMAEAVKTGAVPGAQVVVARNSNVVFSHCYGTIERGGRHAVTDSTIYDLASMSKPLATVSGLMRAYDEGLFEFDDRLSDVIPGLKGTDKESITYRDALYHTTGLPAMISAVNVFAPKGAKRKPELRPDLVSRTRKEGFTTPLAEGLWLADCATDTLMARIYDSTLKQPGRYLYSDLNFCLLKEAEEILTTVDHDEWVATEVFGPIGTSTLGFCPLTYYPLRHIAPTENDTDFRRQRVRGYVHDETAAVSGGVQGNAGLFGNALDVAKVCQMWLNHGQYGGRQIVSAPTVEAFTSPSTRRELTSRKGDEVARGMGFAYVDEESPAPASTYGHTGFTGTSFWVDPDNQIIIVVLTNRVNPSRKTPAFFRNDPRKGVMAAVYQSVTKQ